MDHSDSQKNQKFVNFTSFSDNLSHHPPSKRMGFDDGFGCFAYWHKKHPGNVKAQLQMISPCVILADNLSQDTAVVRGHGSQMIPCLQPKSPFRIFFKATFTSAWQKPCESRIRNLSVTCVTGHDELMTNGPNGSCNFVIHS